MLPNLSLNYDPGKNIVNFTLENLPEKESIRIKFDSLNLIDDYSVTVILNRVKNKRFPNTICKVIHQGVYWQGNPVRDMCQFSYWCDGKTEKYKDMKAISRIIRLAKIVSSGIIVKTLDKATHYHASYVSPGWASNKQFKFITQIGKHIFYVDLR